MKKIKYIYIHMYINKSPHKTLRPIDFDFVLMNFAGSAVFWVQTRWVYTHFTTSLALSLHFSSSNSPIQFFKLLAICSAYSVLSGVYLCHCLGTNVQLKFQLLPGKQKDERESNRCQNIWRKRSLQYPYTVSYIKVNEMHVFIEII